MARPAFDPKHPIDLSAETSAERELRLAWERDRLAEAEADKDTGNFTEGDEATRWLEAELAEATAEFECDDG